MAGEGIYFETDDWQDKSGLNGKSAFDAALSMLRADLSSRFSAEKLAGAGPEVRQQALVQAHATFEEYHTRAGREHLLPLRTTAEEFANQALSYIFGLGPIDMLLADPSIEDVAINGPGEVMIYKGAGWSKTDITFSDSTLLLNILNTAMAKAEKTVNRIRPIADAAIERNRYSVVMNPVSKPSPTAVIRIPHHDSIELGDLVKPWVEPAAKHQVEKDYAITSRPLEDPPLPDYASLPTGGILSHDVAAYLNAAVLSGLNIAVMGPTGVGKTALLTALGRCLPENKRVLIIEDTPEIVLFPESDQPNNVLYLQTRTASLEGVPPITQADLVKLALRQRPDALTLGEARGEEMFDLLNALYTGHSNGLTSFHAAGLHEMFGRVTMMMGQSDRGRFLGNYHMAQMVAIALDILIVLEKTGKERRVKAIGELSGQVEREGDTYQPKIELIFEHTGGRGGQVVGPLRDSAHRQKFSEASIPEHVYSRKV